MTAYALLLRGVNVGGNKKIAMADLKALLARLGCSDVTTVLQSGNAVFSAEGAAGHWEREIERALAADLALTTKCLVRTGPEVAEVLAGHPFADRADNPSRMLAVFLPQEPPADLLAEHDPRALDPENIALGPRVLYQWCPDGISKSPDTVTYISRFWKHTSTGRNWNTVTKLSVLLDAL